MPLSSDSSYAARPSGKSGRGRGWILRSTRLPIFWLAISSALLACAWLALVFEGVVQHAPAGLRSSALLAAYSIATGWWVLQLLPGNNEPSARPYLFAFLIAAAAVTAMMSLTSLPLEVSLLPGAAVIAYVGIQRIMRLRGNIVILKRYAGQIDESSLYFASLRALKATRQGFVIRFTIVCIERAGANRAEVR